MTIAYSLLMLWQAASVAVVVGAVVGTVQTARAVVRLI